MSKTSSVIRSFVRREGRFTQGQQAAFKLYWPKYGIDVEEKHLKMANIFANSHPTVLDIGFGNGEALFTLAKQFPNLNFLGIEVYRPGIGSLLRKLAEAQVNNVRVINMDVMTLLQNNFIAKTFISILVWFPDPWPKKRHHKRRLIQTKFIEFVADKLIEEGELNIATDWQPYAEHIQQIMQNSHLFDLIEKSRIIGERPKTKFERRGEKLGHQVFGGVYKKIA